MDLSDRLARLQQDNSRLRQRLQDTRRLSKVPRSSYAAVHACRNLCRAWVVAGGHLCRRRVAMHAGDE